MKKNLLIVLLIVVFGQCLQAQCSGFSVQVQTKRTCPGSSNGIATALPTGGVTPYQYLWSTSETTQTVTGLSTGTYYVTVTDAINCVKNNSTFIFQANISIQITPTWITCFGMSDGGLTANPNGGTQPYTYVWDNGSTAQSITGLSIGLYFVTVTDDNNCVKADSFQLGQPPLLQSATWAESDSCGNCNGGGYVTSVGGTTPYLYSWSTGSNSTTATSLCAGTYYVTASDIQGCFNIDTIVIDSFVRMQSTISLINNVSCTSLNDGAASVAVSGGTAPYSFLWSDGQTTSTATQLSAGLYLVGVWDSGGCSITDTILIIDSGISFTVSTTNTSCNTADGMATVVPSVLINNGAYQWSNGATTQTVSGLAEGWYSVTVENLDDGCRAKRLAEVKESPGCVVTIEGYVYLDTPLPDCVFDPGTVPYPNAMICLSNGTDSTYTLTDSVGFYSFIGDADTYTIRLVKRQYYELACVGSYTNIVNAPVLQTTYPGGDFYLEYVPQLNLSVYATSLGARPGFDRIMSVTACNDGSEKESGVIRMAHDPLLTSFNGYGQEDFYDMTTRTVLWTYNDLEPGSCISKPVRFSIPVGTSIGTSLGDSVYIDPIAGDVDSSNNVFFLSQLVTNSYDPNDKQNFVGADPFGGVFYEDDKTFLYQVRFQNTGNDTAITVVIRDTLDAATLKVETLRVLNASHSYSVRFDGPDILEFWFENIMLPDSNVNEPASHGHVLFSIDRMANLTEGTVIENQAAIYFDFNDPVLTNTVVNILDIILGADKTVSSELLLPMSVFPNPATDMVQLHVDLPVSGLVQLAVFDASGKLLRDELLSKRSPKGKQQFNLPLNGLSNGSYFVRLKCEGFVGVGRLVVVK